MREQAKKMYLDSNGTIPLKEIAEELGVSDGSVRGWKSRYNWDDELDVTLQRNVTKKKRSATRNNDTSKGMSNKRKDQKNRSGNPNPVKQFTKRNSAAVTHGLFRKYLPEDTIAIMEGMNERSPADLIYDQIQIQYAAIIRAQQIMFVESKDEMIKELKKHKPGEFGVEKEYEFQFAWDRHATFMNAQSRAMSELRNLIKQFNEMASEDDERRLRLEQMQLGVEKTKVEIEAIKGGGKNPEAENWIDALQQVAERRKAVNADE